MSPLGQDQEDLFAMIKQLFVSTRFAGRALILATTAACSLAVTNGCSSDSNPGTSGTGGSTSTGGSGAAGTGGTPAGTGGSTGGTGGSGGMCSAPGGAVTGAANTHCAQADGGMITQSIGACQTSVDAGADTSLDAGLLGGDYGDTNYGSQAYDDDCKYNVSWTSTPICENADVTFTVTATMLAGTDSSAPKQLAAGSPLTGAAPYIEAFKIEGDGGITLAPPTAQTPTEMAGGKYAIGPIQFDEPGQWIIRYHFNEECSDDPEDSPHGHAAFYINVP
jgi:hypothetical protein